MFFSKNDLTAILKAMDDNDAASFWIDDDGIGYGFYLCNDKGRALGTVDFDDDDTVTFKKF